MSAPTARDGSGCSLEVDIAVRPRDVELRLTARPGRITAVIGPNGAGKSTLLGAVSGAVRAEGSVRVDGREIVDAAIHRRRVGHLRQREALFVHLTVLGNVAFGPRARGASRREAHDRARAMLEQLGAADLAARRPHTLSGGQAQRAAIARALAADPEVLLLDEPFAGLDADVSARLRATLGSALRGRTALLVTHDLLDVLALADDVAVLEGGRLIAVGRRDEVLRRPPTVFAARLTGRELVLGRADGEAIVTDGGLRIPGIFDAPLRAGRRAAALVDPSHVRLADHARPDGGARARIRIDSVGRVGSRVLLRGGDLAVEVDAAAAAADLPGLGATVDVLLDPLRTPLYAVDHGHDLDSHR